MVGGGELVASGQTVRAPRWKAAQVLGFDIWEQALALTGFGTCSRDKYADYLGYLNIWDIPNKEQCKVRSWFWYLRSASQLNSLQTLCQKDNVELGHVLRCVCFLLLGFFSCSYWPVLGSQNMMLTFFSLFTSFLLVSCVRSSVNRPPPVCFVFVENFSLTGNDDPSQNNQQLIFVLFPHF